MNLRQMYSLGALLLAGFVAIFDLFVVNIAIVSIKTTLHATDIQVTMIIVAYELAFGLLLITGGRLGDVYGRRHVYQFGMALFSFASVFCGLASDADSLIALRFLQGLCAAVLFPQIYASIRADFAENDARRAFAWLGMIFGVAAIAGQVLGGLLISLNIFGLQWRVIFFVNIPIGLIAILLSCGLTNPRLFAQKSFDWVGVILSGIGISMSLLPLMMIPAWGWGGRSDALIFLGILCLSLFIRHEIAYASTGKRPLIDQQLLSNTLFIKGVVLIMCIYATAGSFTLAFSLFLQSGLRMRPVDAGITYIVTSVGFVMASLLMPRLITGYGNRMILVGGGLYIFSFIGLAVMVCGISGAGQSWMLMPILCALGFTQGMVMTPVLNIALANIPPNYAGMGAGVLSTMQQVGAALGVTAVSIIMQLTLKQRTDLPMLVQQQHAFAYGMLFNIGASILACYLLWTLIKRQNKR